MYEAYISYSAFNYSNCPKILYTEISDKMEYANKADTEEHSDHGLHCLPFH